jgi:hypothetical protein
MSCKPSSFTRFVRTVRHLRMVGLLSVPACLHLLIEGDPQPIFLAGYAGGPVCSVDHPCGPDQENFTWTSGFHPDGSTTAGLQTGQLSITATVPGPIVGAGLPGLLCGGLLGWWRRRLLCGYATATDFDASVMVV